MIEVSRKSDLTGKMNVMTLNTTREQLNRYYNGEGLVQTLFPHLTVEEREFLKTGITPKEWKDTFGE